MSNTVSRSPTLGGVWRGVYVSEKLSTLGNYYSK